jgi:hypothetical protein
MRISNFVMLIVVCVGTGVQVSGCDGPHVGVQCRTVQDGLWELSTARTGMMFLPSGWWYMQHLATRKCISCRRRNCHWWNICRSYCVCISCLCKGCWICSVCTVKLSIYEAFVHGLLFAAFRKSTDIYKYRYRWKWNFGFSNIRGICSPASAGLLHGYE